MPGSSNIICKGQENEFRLRHLLCSIGTSALRYVFHKQTGLSEDPVELRNALQEPAYKRILANCKALTGKQRNTLDPQCNCGSVKRSTCSCSLTVDSHNFDITLLVLLISTFCKIRLPKTGLVSLPPKSDTSLSANLLRLRFVRNELSHNSSRGIDDQLFLTYWCEASNALISLGCSSVDISHARHVRLDAKLYESFLDLEKQLKHMEKCQEGVFWACNAVSTFHGRVPELETLQNLLEDPEVSAEAAVVICGPSGIGKSELVRYYASKFGSECFDCNILWINASDRSSIESSFIELAQYINLSISDQHSNIINSAAIVKKVYDFFQDRRCLIVFDDAPSHDTIVEFLPQKERPHQKESGVVISSTSSNWNRNIFKVVHLDVLLHADAQKLLQDLLQDGDIKCTEDEIRFLAKRLNYFPIALQQAAAYLISHKNVAVQSYTALLETVGERLHKIPISGKYQKTVYSSTKLIMKDLKEKNEISFKILRLLSYMSSDKINVDFFSVMKCLPSNKEESLFVLNEAFDALLAFSIVFERNIPDSKNQFSTHNLIQEMIRLIISEDGNDEDEVTQQSLLRLIVCWIVDSEDQINHCHYGKRWVPHLLSLLFVTKSEVILSGIGDMFHALQRALCNSGNYKSLERTCRKLLERPRKTSAEMTFTLNQSLACGLYHAGKQQEPLNMLADLVDLAKTQFGETDAQFIELQCDMAVVHCNLGETDKAYRYLYESITSLPKISCSSYSQRLNALSRCCRVLVNLGHFQDELILLNRKLILLQEEHFGKEHYDTITSKHFHAISCIDAGMYTEAESVLKELLPTQIRVLGDFHPSTLGTKCTLGCTFYHLNKLEEACHVLTEVVANRTESLGENHIDTLYTLKNLAIVLKCMGKLLDSYDILEIIVPRLTAKLGEDHPSTVDTRFIYDNVLSQLS